MNNALIRQLLKEKDAWDVLTFDDVDTAPVSYMKPVFAVEA